MTRLALPPTTALFGVVFCFCHARFCVVSMGQLFYAPKTNATSGGEEYIHNFTLKTLLTFTEQSLSFEPRHVISNNVVCATSKASAQPAHTRSLIRAFAIRLNII